MRSVILGILLITVFNFSSALYPVRVSELIESEDKTFVLISTFGIACFVFGLMQIHNIREQLSLFQSCRSDVLSLNVSTAVSWIGFTYALDFIPDAAAIDTIVFSIAPILTVFYYRWFLPGKEIKRV